MILIGYHFDAEQHDALKSVGATVLSPATIWSKADLKQDVQLVAVSLRLPESERTRVESLVEHRGTIIRSLEEAAIMDLLFQRMRRKKSRGL